MHTNSCTESGDVPELMPGGLIEFWEPTYDHVPYNLQPWLPLLFHVSVLYGCRYTPYITNLVPRRYSQCLNTLRLDHGEPLFHQSLLSGSSTS